LVAALPPFTEISQAMKYFPNIPEEVLRREWQSYRHLEPDYNKWLKFMHDERKREGDLPGPKLWHIALPIAVMLAFVVGAIIWLVVAGTTE
jgi:hypothetical protein